MRGLRGQLRDATRNAHDGLDEAMRAFDLHSLDGFARFLKIQHAARAPIEAWVAEYCPVGIAPPPQAHLILHDLEQAGINAPDHGAEFTLPGSADPIGLAWALAGSSLGNRTILSELDKHGCTNHPRAFLSHDAMPMFWKQLRPHLERDVPAHEAERAIAGALAVFASFDNALAALPGKLAA